ncbi:hypothetical protein V1264_016520 [Littorina saxatilis]|uniref:HTH CENPB-type domain-containing protein n=1 Tax=Littorina saxatilis TaxID=31220 RepID=A0AAN9GHA7_9CAEN
MPRIKSYTVAFKLSALDYFDNNANGNVSQTASEFGVDRKRIREWRENRNTLLRHQAGKEKKKRKLHGGRDVRSEEVDEGVLEYLDQERAEGRVVRNKDLQRGALELAGGLDIDEFVASPMWLKRCKQRHAVSTRRGTNTNQTYPLFKVNRDTVRPTAAPLQTRKGCDDIRLPKLF